jgi:hypothetical protein
MKYLVIHQNPINDIVYRSDTCGDIVVFTVPDDFNLYTYPDNVNDQALYQIHYPELDLKKIIMDTSLLEYMEFIKFPYDIEFGTFDTRWAESDHIFIFNTYMGMYDHIYTFRKYTVIHHRYTSNPNIEYLNRHIYINHLKDITINTQLRLPQFSNNL